MPKETTSQTEGHKTAGEGSVPGVSQDHQTVQDPATVHRRTSRRGIRTDISDQTLERLSTREGERGRCTQQPDEIRVEELTMGDENARSTHQGHLVRNQDTVKGIRVIPDRERAPIRPKAMKRLGQHHRRRTSPTQEPGKSPRPPHVERGGQTAQVILRETRQREHRSHQIHPRVRTPNLLQEPEARTSHQRDRQLPQLPREDRVAHISHHREREPIRPQEPIQRSDVPEQLHTLRHPRVEGDVESRGGHR